jgi:hypothetical protein
MTSFQTTNTKYTKDFNATGAFAYLQGMRRIVRLQCGVYECQYGSFLFGPMSSVEFICEFGPVDDFGNIASLSDNALDSLEITLN